MPNIRVKLKFRCPVISQQSHVITNFEVCEQNCLCCTCKMKFVPNFVKPGLIGCGSLHYCISTRMAISLVKFYGYVTSKDNLVSFVFNEHFSWITFRQLPVMRDQSSSKIFPHTRAHFEISWIALPITIFQADKRAIALLTNVRCSYITLIPRRQ